MKLATFIILLFCAFLISISAALLYYSSLVLDVQYIPMDLRVSTVVGINADTDALHFGKVTSPGGGDRFIVISNDYQLPLTVLISSSGRLKSWVSLNESRFILGPSEKHGVKVSVNLPAGVEQGVYNGTLKILFRRLIV